LASFTLNKTRWRTQDNQELLRSFFEACASVLHEGSDESIDWDDDSSSTMASSSDIGGRDDKNGDGTSDERAGSNSESEEGTLHQPRKPTTVTVTLVRGQGGTIADSKHVKDNLKRPSSDSWRIHEQAVAAGFVLVSATPFDSIRWKRRGYISRGHRKSIKGASASSAIEHRFMRQCDVEPNLKPYFGKRVVW